MNKSKRLVCLAIRIVALCFLSVNTDAQSLFSGRVVDAVTKEPLAFSTVSIQGGESGVVSNFRGEFELKLATTKNTDTLLVSMLGYKSFRKAVNQITNSKSLLIQLEESILMLEEIEVTNKALSALEIVNKVIENIPNNYPSSPYLLEGFTRSHKHECGKYVTLHEAVFNVYGQGYHKKSAERIYLKESRQSQYAPYYHSRVLRNNRNLFISMRHINDVLFRSYSLNTKFNSYEIEKYSFIEDQLIYVIKSNHSSHVIHTMYINAEDFALLKVTMNMETVEGEDWNPLLNKGPSSDSLDFKVTRIFKTIQFEKANGFYSSKYMDWLVEGALYHKASKEEYCNWGFRFETMFDKITLDAEKPSNQYLMNPKSKQDPPSTPYNSAFWDNYSLINDFPITPQIVIDLEVNGPLKDQFALNSKSK